MLILGAPKSSGPLGGEPLIYATELSLHLDRIWSVCVKKEKKESKKIKILTEIFTNTDAYYKRETVTKMKIDRLTLFKSVSVSFSFTSISIEGGHGSGFNSSIFNAHVLCLAL